MAGNKGCLKKTLIGCGGLLAVVILFVVITTTLAIKQVNKRQETEPVLEPLAESLMVHEPGQYHPLAAGHPGRVIILVGQGEFSVEPAEPGDGPSAEAEYSEELHEFVQSYETLADSTWVYKVGFRRIKSGFAAMMESMFGNSSKASIKIYLPRDLPFELDVQGEAGGLEMELGGLWITAADIGFEKGGIILEISEPMAQPMDKLILRTKMGGLQAEDLGNASPRVLGVNCAMGGADVGMEGQWLQDCDARVVVTMGGIAVRLPDDVEVTGIGGKSSSVKEDTGEMPEPVINFSISEKMGEIDILR